MISVCLATYNGEKYIKEQLISILSELSEDDEIIISDDHSTDKTIDIIKALNDKRIRIFENPGKNGVSTNFANAIEHATGSYIFLSDQDDVWIKGKVELSLNSINAAESANPSVPVLVYTDIKIVDECLNVIVESSFAQSGQNPEDAIKENVLTVSNRLMGCTMAFNELTKQYILPMPENIIMHDWWIALCVAKNGIIVPIKNATLLYRQHSGNVIGSTIVNKPSLMSRIKLLPQKFAFNIKIYQMVKRVYKIDFFTFALRKALLHVPQMGLKK